MHRIFSVLAVAALLIAAPACSSTKPPSSAATQGNKIITALKDLSSMYEKKNLPGFMSLISGKYKERKAFAASLQSVFSKYEAVHFTIQYSKMLIMIDSKGMTQATFNWDSDWQAGAGSVQKNSGRVIFIFDPDDATLVSIDGKNPFIPQAIETPKQ